MASSDENLDDSDEEMICCHVCLLKFNTVDRKPKFLDCHHFFCFRCIKAFSKGTNVPCPTCRHVTNMTGREIEELSTNNIVLRLVSIAMERAREKTERQTTLKISSPLINSFPGKLWCVECSTVATPVCQRKEHMMCDYMEVFKENMDLLENRVRKCDKMWDKAIEDRRKIHRVYGEVLESLRVLQAEIMNRVEMNDSNIAQIETKKQESRGLADPAGYKSAVNGNVVSIMSNVSQAIAKIDAWDAEANKSQFIAQRLLQNLTTVEENCIGVSFSNVNPGKDSLRCIELLKKLQLSFSGSRFDAPILKACVSVVSFLVLKLAEEQSKAGPVRVENKRQNNAENIDNLCKETHARRARSSEGPDGNDADSESGDETGLANAVSAVTVAKKREEPKAMTFRDKLLRTPAKIQQEWQTVAKSPVKTKKNLNEWQTVTKAVKAPSAGGGQSKCYFRFSVDGVVMDRVIFQLDHASAPVMSSKFVEMCTTKTGYQGSRIFKNIKGEAVMGGSRWFHNPNEEEVRKDIFVADRSEIKEKRGSIRFQVKSAAYPRADVSTEFQIILVNRPGYHKCTTVFGQVIEGLSICDRISEMNIKDRKVMIAECGIC